MFIKIRVLDKNMSKAFYAWNNGFGKIF